MGEVTDDGVVASCQPPLACRKGDRETSATRRHTRPYPSHPPTSDPSTSPLARADVAAEDVPSGSPIPPQTMGFHQWDPVKTRGFDKLQVLVEILSLKKQVFLQKPKFWLFGVF